MSEKIEIIPPEEMPETVQKPKNGRPPTYPFDELSIGGGFEVPEGKLQSVRQLVSNKNNAGLQRGHKDEGKRYHVGEGADGKYYVRRER